MGVKSLSVLCAATVALAQSAPTVTISNGALQGGKCPQTDINYFLSIPYANPPVGDLRFAAPQAYNQSFTETYNATNKAPACPQFGTFFVETGAQSEDCLFIDVYAPASATTGSNLPVKVWIYGGGDSAGGISNAQFTGCFAANDSIQVSINYRVGPLGFLALEAAGLTGNYAIQDQLLGLQWVQDNIAAFGGDKNQVMLYGQSAGAFNAWTITTLPQAKSLFRSAVLESGAGVEFPTLNETKEYYEYYVKQLNCSVSDVACLRSKSPAELNNTFNALPTNGTPLLFSLLENMGRGPSWGPIVDGTIIPVQPATAGVKVPSIIGSTTMEGTVFVLLQYLKGFTNLTQTDYSSFLSYNFGPYASTINSTFALSKFAATPYPVFYAMSTVITDYGFKCPTYRALLGGAANGVEVYTYSFNHTPSCSWISGLPAQALPLVGASHTADLPFVFGIVDTTLNNCTFTDAERELGVFIRDAWTSMASSGTPGGSWPTFDANASQGVVFNDAAAVATVDYSVCAFWDKINLDVLQLDANQTAAAAANATATTTGSGSTKTNAGERAVEAGGAAVAFWAAVVGAVLLLGV